MGVEAAEQTLGPVVSHLTHGQEGPIQGVGVKELGFPVPKRGTWGCFQWLL